MSRTFYELLDVPVTASRPEIETEAQNRLSGLAESDGDHAATIERIDVARRVLTDREERRRYDRLGHEAYVREARNEIRAERASEESTDREASEPATTVEPIDNPFAIDDRFETDSQPAARTDDETAITVPDQHRELDDGPVTVQREIGVGFPSFKSPSWVEQNVCIETSLAVRGVPRLPEPDDEQTPRSRTSIAQESALDLAAIFVLYPVFLYSSVTPAFLFPAKAIVAVCTLCVVVYLLSMPEISALVFGSWSVAVPLLAVWGVGWHPTSTLTLAVTAACWIPLALAVLSAWIYRN
jgi:hypothetical protein